MKTLILAVTFATLALTAAAPLQAAATSGITALQPMEFSRHGCDTKHDIKQHPRCS